MEGALGLGQQGAALTGVERALGDGPDLQGASPGHAQALPGVVVCIEMDRAAWCRVMSARSASPTGRQSRPLSE